ncbi:MAG: GNAT family N-acetyltransferase [Ilumatobacteraceae bacterium]|nr:GNAT family N-acetyltransferase [Ilumatobacteraceae bacterium]
MMHPVWPLFDLRVRTPRLELRYIDDEMAAELALLATQGIHDPEFMPFAMPWSTEPSPTLERNTMQFYWRCRAELSPTNWNINFAALVDGIVVGTTGLMAHDFATLRVFETGSGLGRAHQGQGLGKEMRLASLHLGFLGFGALWSTTSAWVDNGPSLGVTGSLGYIHTGHRRSVRQSEPGQLRTFEMSRDDFIARVQRDDISLHGVDECLPMLGLDQLGPA